MANRETITVSALNRYVKALLENDEILSQVWVEGELSDVHVHLQSGHIYFKVVDGNASVRAVMFRTYAERLRFRPKDGMKVMIACRVTLYEKGGEYQLNAFDIMEVGVGKRQTELEQAKARLAADGLFEQSRKRMLPASPARISVITSATGSVIRDIQNVCGRRDPLTEILLYPVYVQGVFAVDAIIDAVKAICRDTRGSELVIFARGGGSADDLWIFNDEGLVRAACALPVPFISAVGHETDFTLLDFAADLRAPTPSAAAELAVPDVRQQVSDVSAAVSQLGGLLTERVRAYREEIRKSMLQTDSAAAVITQRKRDALGRAESELDSLSPLRILTRGYAYITSQGSNIRSVRQVSAGDSLKVTLSDGTLDCTVDEVTGK
ncbi:MAG: exodeoxyribonuclease VII large subunit [Oscillospiraceae bacterium]|nr:exodeoxyribonuclease VII large subunit [Oscillospiraceae bacterium]